MQGWASLPHATSSACVLLVAIVALWCVPQAWLRLVAVVALFAAWAALRAALAMDARWPAARDGEDVVVVGRVVELPAARAPMWPSCSTPIAHAAIARCLAVVCASPGTAPHRRLSRAIDGA